MRKWMIWVLVALVPVFGCGEERQRVAVSGEVTVDGEPVKEGSISFIPLDGTDSPMVGGSIRDGTFSIPRPSGPSPGEFRVEISAFEEYVDEQQSAINKQGAMFGRPASEFPAGVEKQTVMRKNVIPSRYNVNSELRTTIPDQSQHTVSFSLQTQ